MGELKIEDLRVSVEGKPILKGVDLTVETGQVHVLMGRNGSGKSTLANALMGHPRYTVDSGQITLDGEDLLELKPNERALKGLFLAFQYPVGIPGVSVANFLRVAMQAKAKASALLSPPRNGGEVKAAKAEPDPVPTARTGRMPKLKLNEGGFSAKEFRLKLKEQMKRLKIDESFTRRYVNEGFSGGEKKRLEILQMAMLEPRFAILDEPDSGLDIDAVRTVAEGINALRGPDKGMVIITHYERILKYIHPDFVHVMVNGRIVRSGGHELVAELEERGYDWLVENDIAEPGELVAATAE